MNGLQEHSRNVVSLEGLWREKPLEQVKQPSAQFADYTDEDGRIALAELHQRVMGRATATQSVPSGNMPQKLASPWGKRLLWLAAGTVAWGLACVGVRHVFGNGATMLEAVLLILILGAAIGMASLSEP